MFKEKIGKSIEVYVDDLLVKSKESAQHLHNLCESFGILHQYKMKLNPTKCTFGVKAGKILGFVMSKRGIEASLKKIDAIFNMKSPKNINKTK